MTKLLYRDDKSGKISKERLLNEPHNLRPHVVIVGSGASKQAFPEGDRNGRKLPVMDELVECAELKPILDKYEIKLENHNFELLYSELYENNPESEVLKIIEDKIRIYFSEIEIPDTPTLYDHLLLSLRPKDLIATFNWDPLLYDAWERNRYRVPMPEMLFLHGNVRIGYCEKHNICGENGRYCPECNTVLTPSKLLFPIAKKNYSDDPFIKRAWDQLKLVLESAFTITIFGYGAPVSDKDALELMLNAWKGKSKRELETTEFIDIKSESEIQILWSDFIYSHHYLCYKDFYDSYIPKHPRRSCEALYVPTVLGRFVDDFPLPREKEFDDLYSWLEPLIKAEQELNV